MVACHSVWEGLQGSSLGPAVAAPRSSSSSPRAVPLVCLEVEEEVVAAEAGVQRQSQLQAFAFLT